MSDPRYTFKRFEQRNDIGDIKSKCYETSPQATDNKRRSMTTYRHDYVPYPIEVTPRAKAPPEGIHIGGGNLAPTREEMRSNYQNFFKKFDAKYPEIAKPIPESQLFEYNFPIPTSTQQDANNEVVGKTPKYDNDTAKKRTADNRGAHFVLGSDGPVYETDYQRHFKNFNAKRPEPIDNELQKSSIQFDKDAGYGPHTRSAWKKHPVPQKPDAERPNHLKVNYDVGYSNTPYITTNQAYATDPRYFKRTNPVKAPQCAEFADHGPYAQEWKSTYNQDYDRKRRDPNDLDLEDLKKTHWDQGHDETDWSRRKMATSPIKPKKEFIDLQKSNVVFKGDGSMAFNTTQNDLVGVYDRNGESRWSEDITDARADHLFLGGEGTNYESTAKAANRLAGVGKPAEIAEDLHHKKSVAFARGGTFDRFATDPDISEQRYKRVKQPSKIDGRYYTQTHFDLDATSNNKSRYKTTYFETICRPKIQAIHPEYK